MADSLHLVVTKTDGTVVDISGPLAGITVTETAPVIVPPPPPPPPPPTGEPVIPATAVTVDMLPNVIPWKMNHDAGTPGDSIGTTTYPFTVPDGSIVRQFLFTDTGKGGEIYHVNVMADSTAFNTFCYEAVESSDDWSNIACAEKDLEHVDATGTYVDEAIQLSSYSGTVEFTGNHHWISSNIKADPTKFAPKVLHTTRLYSRDNGDGTVTYIGAYVDGVYTAFTNATIGSVGGAKWGKKILNLQLQYDGKSAASVQSTIYMHVLKVHAWKG